MNALSEARTVTVREVGPRDGLQMAKAVMPTEAKLRWIAAMAAAGVPEMEVASFVPPAAMPQMADAAEVTVGAVTETQWRGFCQEFGLEDLLNDPELAGMRRLAAGRPRILPRVAEVFRALPKAELMARCEALGLPFAPIARPGELFDDPHLLASGGLLPVDLSGAEAAPGGSPARTDVGLPGLPVSLPGSGRPGLRRQPPRVGEHGAEIAREAGLSEADLATLLADGTLMTPPERIAAASA